MADHKLSVSLPTRHIVWNLYAGTRGEPDRAFAQWEKFDARHAVISILIVMTPASRCVVIN